VIWVKTINKDFSYTEIIKKSKFLTFLHPITTQEQAKTLLEKYKKEYSDATHICYAYILDENTFKYTMMVSQLQVPASLFIKH
jgi:putative IMPACT (imprinted ancient) family translation regulator